MIIVPRSSRVAGATVFVALLSIVLPAAAQTISLADLRSRTHFHGIAVDRTDPARIFLATHHGFFVVGPDGRATRVSRDTNDYMGFTPHPTDPAVLFASGHPTGGGNMGFIVSKDGGRSWRQLSKGARGPVDFHQMDVSKADPDVIYGSYRGLQVSRDGGKSWKLTSPLPEGLIDLAASAVDANRLYAGTKGGLLYSTDAGATWRTAHFTRSPVTLVQTGYSGELYAFVLGVGLLRTQEPTLGWETVSNVFGQQYLLHLAVAPGDPRRLFAVTNKGVVTASTDGGVTWAALGGGGGGRTSTRPKTGR